MTRFLARAYLTVGAVLLTGAILAELSCAWDRR
jgi:hypothetical protein